MLYLMKQLLDTFREKAGNQGLPVCLHAKVIFFTSNMLLSYDILI